MSSVCLMRCPYCGYHKIVKKADKRLVYECPRCKYQFEVSFSKMMFEKIFSIPFSSVIVFFVIQGMCFSLSLISNEFLSKSFWNSFSAFNALFLVVQLFLYFIYVEPKQIFLIKDKVSFIRKIVYLSPFLKISMLIVVTIITIQIMIIK